MRYLVLILLFSLIQRAFGQAVIRDCVIAQPLTQTSGYCSSDGQYNNESTYQSAWFQFTANAYDINISVSGSGSGGTLTAPQITLYSDCSGDEVVGNVTSGNNITTLYKGGLIVGNTYYIQVTGSGNQTGTFKLCLNNYNPVVKPGQDCGTASFLCTTETISQQNVTGAGLNNDEAKGTCLSVPGQVSESNSAWYKWQAANNGTLVFTITPTNTKDDIDWVLFDLGTTGDCANVSPANALRCKAGYGVDNTDCPGSAVYYRSGLDFKDTDIMEPPGCGQGQNGKLKFLTMQQGHYYGLLINNFTSGNNGFTLAFTDQEGKSGTGKFAGPQPAIAFTETTNCASSPQFVFTSLSTGYEALNWSFGNGASIDTVSGAGPYAVNYTTAGPKTVTLAATGPGGCTVFAMQRIIVGIPPAAPEIQINQRAFCINDTVRLSVVQTDSATYQWTGPNGFASTGPSVKIPVTGPDVAGVYSLTVSLYGCSSAVSTITVPPPLASPTASFTTDPARAAVAYGPLTVQFMNGSSGADRYVWDFGDGSGSTLENPSHTYSQKGEYTVKLTAINSNNCSSTAVISGAAIIEENRYIFIPNAISPNGDGKNDVFKVVITNLKTYTIQIFDRWGAEIFTSADINHYWDGTYKGRVVPEGTYYFVIEATGSDGSTINRSGYVAVVRN